MRNPFAAVLDRPSVSDPSGASPHVQLIVAASLPVSFGTSRRIIETTSSAPCSIALTVASTTAVGIVLVNLRLRRSSPSTMTSPRSNAAFARERDELAVNFVLYISDIERFSGAHVPKHPVRGYQPGIGRVA